MATVVFYEKPGCLNNSCQKPLLAAASHTVWTRDLLPDDWMPRCRAGFEADVVDRWGLNGRACADDLETCLGGHAQKPCPEPEAAP